MHAAHRDGEADGVPAGQRGQAARAFKAFDPDDKGFIDPDYLKDVLTSRGDAFREEEVKELMSAAIDSKTGNIFYEDFAEVLAADGRVI